jgi:hypothetical protein
MKECNDDYSIVVDMVCSAPKSSDHFEVPTIINMNSINASKNMQETVIHSRENGTLTTPAWTLHPVCKLHKYLAVDM